MSNFEQEHEDLIKENDQLTGEVERLRQWVSDCQSGMYVNCVYCGHRYGPDKTTPVAHADLLKAHIEVCPDHPMSALKKENATLRRMLEGRAKYHQKVEEHLRKISKAALPVYDDAMSERIWVGMGESLRRDDEGPPQIPAQMSPTHKEMDTLLSEIAGVKGELSAANEIAEKAEKERDALKAMASKIVEACNREQAGTDFETNDTGGYHFAEKVRRILKEGT